jgi:branched-chain amino acid transport system ATP-binding protein
MTLLDVTGLSAGYGKADVLQQISLTVAERQLVAIVGPNGAGKSTLMHSLMRLLPSRGAITFEDQPAGDTGWLVRHGVVLVPETRTLFTDMSVDDNLLLGGFARRRQGSRRLRTAKAEVFDLLPRLAERRHQTAGTLSGGERQMLALGRALMGQPRLLLLDEPSLGLAPKIVAQIFAIIRDLRDRGIAILLVEQNARAALQMADYGYVLEMGRISLQGPSATLASDARIIETYLGRRQPTYDLDRLSSQKAETSSRTDATRSVRP